MDQATKQQIVERVKQANNILVTASAHPSVDQLAACIGLTLFLNKLEKHATAVFSGPVPSTIEFLQPEKTLEPNTDSLRDFIISLDKAKADKLRYKVEDQMVRIFITPYRTSLSEKDLVFSEGDFNVEVVIALGLKDPNELDAAIMAHGKILHDATVIAVNTGQQKAPEIGQINWQDPTASSLSEMLVSISESFGAGLIDNQIATAFLTGIVAETDRFSNNKTSPKVMTMSAQLMAAGANQQLIVSKLEPPSPSAGGTAPPRQPKAPASPPPTEPGVLIIPHEDAKPDVPFEVIKSGEIHIDEHGNIKGDQIPAPGVQPSSLPVSGATLPSGEKQVGEDHEEPLKPPPPAPPPALPMPPPPEEKKTESSPVATTPAQEPLRSEKTPELTPGAAPITSSSTTPGYIPLPSEPPDITAFKSKPAPAAQPEPDGYSVTIPKEPVSITGFSQPGSPPLPGVAKASEPTQQVDITSSQPARELATPTLNLPTNGVPKPQPPSLAQAPHTLLNPSEQQPVINSPLSADTQPSWRGKDFFDDATLGTGAASGLLGHAQRVEPPQQPTSAPTLAALESPSALIDSARSAVEQARPVSQAPAMSIGSTPLSYDLHPREVTPPQQTPNSDKKPPPPPVPPPLRLDSGAIIPSYPPSGSAAAPASPIL